MTPQHTTLYALDDLGRRHLVVGWTIVYGDQEFVRPVLVPLDTLTSSVVSPESGTYRFTLNP